MPLRGVPISARGIALAIAALASFAAVGPALAEDAPAADTVYTLPPIVVEAAKPHVDMGLHRSGFVTLLDMGPRRDRVEDLSSVLSQSIGVHVRQYGGLGSFATVSIRGSSAKQVDVYLDGVPLNDAYSGIANLGDLPLDGIGRVEVFRGSTPPYLGSSSIGGAINLVTDPSRGYARHSPLSHLEANQSFGSFGTSRLAVSFWSDLSYAKLFVHAGRLKSEGDFEYVDTVTPFNAQDDSVTVRRNNYFESYNVVGRLIVDIPVVGEGAVSYNGLSREGGVAGLGSFQSLTARAERRSHLINAQVAPAFWSGQLQTFLRANYSTANEKFHDLGREITLTSQDSDNTFETHGGRARVRWQPMRLPFALEASYETLDERFLPRMVAPQPSAGPERNRSTQITTVAGDIYLSKVGLVLSATGRFLEQQTEFYDPPRFPWLPPTPQGVLKRQAQTPQVGFRWMPTGFLTLKGNWGRSFRQPTMLELFGNTGSVTGSADLAPEEGTNRDIGAVLSPGDWGTLSDVFVEVVYLDNEIDNLILFFPNSQYTSRPTNIGAARIQGWELSLSTLWWHTLRLAGNYTRLDSRDTGPIPYYNGNWLPGRPRDDLALFLDFTPGRWSVGYELHWLGKNYLKPANFEIVPDRKIHNVIGKITFFSGHASLSAEARNIADNQISDVGGFPLPGRSFYVTLGVQSGE